MSEQNDTPIAELRAAADRGKEAERKAAALERENAFIKAGIDVDDPRAKYFVAGYDGELTKDAIVAEATVAGVLTPPAPPAQENGEQEQQPEGGRRQPTQEELAQDTLQEQVTGGAAPPGKPAERDEMEVGWEKFSERRQREPVSEASAEVIGRMLDLGVKGDPRYNIGAREGQQQ